MFSRRSFFGMLGGAAAAVPVASLPSLAPEQSAVEISAESKYLLVLKFPWPLRSEVHERLGRHLEEFLRLRGLQNVSPLILDSEAELEVFRLDPPA